MDRSPALTFQDLIVPTSFQVCSDDFCSSLLTRLRDQQFSAKTFCLLTPVFFILVG